MQGCNVPSCAWFSESTFQPITDNDQNCLRSCIGKNNMAAIDTGVRFDWDRKRKLIIVFMMLMDQEKHLFVQ